MKPSITQLIFLVCTLDAATSLAVSIPFYVSSDMRARNVEILNVHSRNIIAREPIPADLTAAAAVGIGRRSYVEAAIEVAQMITDVVTNIKGAIAADKEVRCHLFVVLSMVLPTQRMI